jgi:hypothetical protein
MIDRKTQLIKAFCAKGKLNDYKEEVEHLIVKILDSNCLISDCDTCETSLIEQSKETNVKNHIRISFKYEKEKPIHIIWDILHEYGHHLSGHPDELEKSIEREKEAWDLGQKIIATYPKLIIEQKDYENYRDKCLKTYSKNNS